MRCDGMSARNSPASGEAKSGLHLSTERKSLRQAELAAWRHKSVRGLSDKVCSKHTETNSGHGRIEKRTCQQLLVNKNWLDKKNQWRGLKSVIQITSEVHDKSTEKDSVETRWYLSSLDLNAEQALNCVRSHWQVESMHWVLDMTFREDESRIRKAQGPLVFNVMRKIAMALFKQDETKMASIKAKRKMAGLDDSYRSTLLESGIKMR
jgi:predicted transposase YbfD/YdcC